MSDSSDLPELPQLMSHPFFRSAYGPKLRVTHVCKDDRTVQSFKDECDINRILSSYAMTGQITHLNPKPPQWGDVQAVDFQTAMQTVVDARASFDTLPAKVRDRFRNDPAQLLLFLRDPANLDEAVKLGLCAAPPAPPPPPAGSSSEPAK